MDHLDGYHQTLLWMFVPYIFLTQKTTLPQLDKRKMLSLLITSVNYSDYLEFTLRYNCEIFDAIYIITSPLDTQIVEVIEKYNKKNNIHIFYTDIFYQDGPWGKTLFNKGGALDFGLKNIEKKDWIVIGDADTIYPFDIKNIVNALDKNHIYTMPRQKIMDPSLINSCVEEMNKEYHTRDNIRVICPSKHFDKTHRIIGYCQLFNFDADIFKNKNITYPHGHNCRSIDTIFARQFFTKKRRRTLSNKYCIHIGPTEINWNGRASVPYV